MVVYVLTVVVNAALADVKSQAIRETTEYVLKKFGREAAEQGAETLTRKIETLAIKHGDDALVAVKKVGPSALRLVDDAGVHGAESVKLLARYGTDAMLVVTKPNRLALVSKYGDDAAEALVKHGELADPLVESLGQPAATALKNLSPKNGVQLAKLATVADDAAKGTASELAKIGRSEELLNTVARYGDRAMDFVWKHKAALATTAALAAFLADPQPFIDGTRDITKVGLDATVKPLAEATGDAAVEAARRTEWTYVLLATVVCVGLLAGINSWLQHRRELAKPRKP